MSNSSLIPLGTYLLKVHPGVPVSISDEDYPVTVRITMAAIDPESVDGESTPSTLRILKRPDPLALGGYLDSDDEEDDSEDDEEESEEEEEEEEEAPKKGKKANGSKKADEDVEMDDEDDEEDSEDDDDEDDFEIDPVPVCTLSPKTAYQQPLDLVISANEEVLFEVTGSYTVSLVGNYVSHPFNDEDDYDSEDDDDSDEDYDLSPDEDEILEGYSDEESDDLDDIEDHPRITPVDSDDEEEIKREAKILKAEAAKKANGKRAAEDEDLDALIEKDSEKEKPSKKQLKKMKAADGSAAAAPAAKEDKKAKNEGKESPKDKKVTFAKNLEQGPTGKGAPAAAAAAAPAPAAAAPKTVKLDNGLVIEDKTIGEGAGAKNGQKVGVRYIGKLQSNGKVFDSNTKGKPFTFNLGKGQVIKGWDLGVKGMALKGERRLTIPAALAYGKKGAPPDIPGNATLIFEIKLVSLK
ncbi:hypothetical protein BZA70DRAFT_249661 [Myxozyma melibiosi]|uniref:FK506-binding protein n=1 Tax=Myxozyma melibiosi TaxID=54550 RepID=A0ABR1F2H8_9ASCO